MPKLDLPQRGLEWGDLAIILAIGRAGSLSGAARALGKTHSTIFRNITAIEEKTTVRFFDRFDTGYVPTDAGRIALDYAERVEAEFAALDLEVLGQDGRLRGRLRVTCPEAFASDHMPGLARRFMAEHPEIQVDVSPGHGAADLSKREAEVAIRATRKPPETSFGRKICAFRFALYCTEDYIAGAGDKPLGEHSFCLIEGSSGWLVPMLWPTREEADAMTVFQCRASRAVQNAAAEGLGLTFLPCYVGDADPRLIRVSDPIEALDLDLWVLTHPDLADTPRIRTLMRFICDAMTGKRDLIEGRLG